MENWVPVLRRELPLAEDTVYLDCAFDCGGSLLSRRAMDRYFEDWRQDGADPDTKDDGAGRRCFIRAAEETRALLARFIGAPGPDTIAFTHNTTEGINLILQGFPFQKGDNVVCARTEHPAVLMPILNLEPFGVEARLAAPSNGFYVTGEDLLAACNERTRLLVLSHVSGATGYRVDLEALCRAAHARGIFVVADAIQSLGCCDLDVSACGVDAVSCGGYKYLYALESVGFLYCSPSLLLQLRPVLAGVNACLKVERSPETVRMVCSRWDNARRLEYSTPDYPGIYALRASMELLLPIGGAALGAYVEKLFQRLHAGLSALGCRVVTPGEPGCHVGTVCLALDEADRKAAYDHFSRRGIMCTRSGHLRFSLAPFNTPEDVERTLNAASAFSWT